MEVLYCSEFSNRRKPGGKPKFGIFEKRSFIVKENVLIPAMRLNCKGKSLLVDRPPGQSKPITLQSNEVNAKDVVQTASIEYPTVLIYVSAVLSNQSHDKYSRFSSLENKSSAQNYGVTAQYYQLDAPVNIATALIYKIFDIISKFTASKNKYNAIDDEYHAGKNEYHACKSEYAAADILLFVAVDIILLKDDPALGEAGKIWQKEEVIFFLLILIYSANHYYYHKYYCLCQGNHYQVNFHLPKQPSVMP
jgi:hypothetical protein